MKALAILLLAVGINAAEPLGKIYSNIQTGTEASGKDYAVHNVLGFLVGVAIYESLPNDLSPLTKSALSVAGTTILAIAKESTDKHYCTTDVREWAVGASVTIIWEGLR
jgi:hypothetical protein